MWFNHFMLEYDKRCSWSARMRIFVANPSYAKRDVHAYRNASWAQIGSRSRSRRGSSSLAYSIRGQDLSDRGEPATLTAEQLLQVWPNMFRQRVAPWTRIHMCNTLRNVVHTRGSDVNPSSARMHIKFIIRSIYFNIFIIQRRNESKNKLLWQILVKLKKNLQAELGFFYLNFNKLFH